MNEDKTVILARVQSAPGVDAIEPALGLNPSPYQTDAMLVSAADVQVQATALTRPNYNPSLSKDTQGVGRMLQQLTFTHELRASGAFGVAPRLGRLLRACGMAETAVPNTAPATIADAVGAVTNSANANATVIGKGAVAPTKNFDTYKVYVATGGQGAAAKFLVVGTGFSEVDNTVGNSLTNNGWTNSKQGTVAIGGTVIAPTYTFDGAFAFNEIIEVWFLGVRFYYQIPAGGQTAAQVATAIAAKIDADARFVGTAAAAGVITGVLAGTAVPISGEAAGVTNIPLGASGASVTIPNGFAALTAGDQWDIALRRPGIRYDPISDDIPALTFYVYLDGALHRVTDARGTFTMTANAGEYPTLAFTFTGRYNEPVDAAIPTGLVFEKSKPYKVELAEAAVLGLPNACAQAFTFDLAASIQPKDCMNAEEAIDELRFSERTPTAGVNPEAQKPSIYNPWTRMRREETTRLHVRGGVRGGVGNLWRFQADAAQYSAANYTARNKLRAHDFQFALARSSDAGNDEFFFHFA